MPGQRFTGWLRVVILAVVFVIVLVASWLLLSWLGHPHGVSDRWLLCTALAAAVTAGVQGLVLGQEPQEHKDGTHVEGEDVRAAGAGASGNVFGNRAKLKGKSGHWPSRDASEVGGPTIVRGNRNRVAGADAHDNLFGDDTSIDE